jgi:hypothetical protein
MTQRRRQPRQPPPRRAAASWLPCTALLRRQTRRTLRGSSAGASAAARAALAAAPQRRRGAAAAAASSEDNIIDLTADDGEDAHAVAHAFRQWELIDLTGAAEAEAEAAPARAEEASAGAAAAAAPEIVEDALAPQRASIRAFLASRGAALRVAGVEANPHAAPGAPLYARFVAARARCADASVALVFHGTPEANVESICERGLDPRRRKRQLLGAARAARRGAHTHTPAAREDTAARAPKPSLADLAARRPFFDLRFAPRLQGAASTSPRRRASARRTAPAAARCWCALC